MTPARLPVVLITGFLGSGKTTLLNRLLAAWPDSALLINEFGQAAVDQALIRRQDIPVTLLGGGCLCCQLRGALPPTLKNLCLAWSGRGGPGFGRLLIETSGAASPEPVLDVLLRERWLAPRLHLQSVITTVSAAAGEGQLARYAEAQAQLAWADAIVITQSDLAEPGRLARLESRLDRLAPATPRFPAWFGAVDADRLLARPAFRAQPAPAVGAGHDFHSLSLRFAQPVDWPRLAARLQDLLARYPQLLRVKGVVTVQGRSLAVQCAAGRLFPAVELPPRPEVEGRLVFISEGEIAGLAEGLAGLGGVGKA